jgi:hypothetical protein
MSYSKVFLLLTLLATATASLAALTPQDALKPADHETLGKKIAEFVAARRNNKGADKALEELGKELDKQEKKAKRSLLALPGDLGKALWASYDYDKSTSAVKKGKVAVEDMPAYYGEKQKLGYAVWAPAKYVPQQAYPLILCLPAAGQKVNEHINEQWIDPALRDNAIIAAVTLPAKQEDWLATETDRETGGRNLMAVYAELVKTHAIDFDRVFIAGRAESVELATVIGMRYPHRFAGVVGRAGDVGAEVQAENLSNLGLFYAGGGANVTALGDKLDKAGFKNCTIKPEATEADIWEWMQAHPRVSMPAEITLYPGTPLPNSAYWLELPPWDGQGTAYVKAKADRASNTITVEGEGVSGFTLYFNDQLVDLDKQLKVICNGTENVGLMQRSVSSTASFIALGRCDPGRILVASRNYDLPPKPKPK